MSERDQLENEIDALLDELRTAPPEPLSDTQMARLLGDADRVQAAWAAPAPPRLRTKLWQVIGGWSGAGSLVAASATGLWLGFAPPAALADYMTQVTGESIAVTLPDEDILMQWGEG